jgi:UDP-N-acetyl-D-galactosamine dehydrogenase
MIYERPGKWRQGNSMLKLKNVNLAVVGLGYVGLPLAVEFGKKMRVLGFDIGKARGDALNSGHDATREVSDGELKSASGLSFCLEPHELAGCNIFIVTVPTPIDEHSRPDLTPLIKVSESIGSVLKKGDIVVYGSTLYPGATEEDCVPVVERVSGLKFSVDFFAGYSPERKKIGDKFHRVTNIKRVTSGSTPEVAGLVDELYSRISTAGTHI